MFLCINKIESIVQKPEEVAEDIQATSVKLLGNYGHSSGIYPYRLFRELAEAEMQEPVKSS